MPHRHACFVRFQRRTSICSISCSICKWNELWNGFETWAKDNWIFQESHARIPSSIYKCWLIVTKGILIPCWIPFWFLNLDSQLEKHCVRLRRLWFLRHQIWLSQLFRRTNDENWFPSFQIMENVGRLIYRYLDVAWN